LTPLSVLYVASVAKQFTAASVGLLVLDGALNIQEDIRRYLPEPPEYPSPVRVGHLLAHTSGLPSGYDLDRSAGMTAHAQFSTSDRARVIATATLQAEPGTAHQYSNHGYVLLAELVRRVCGVPLGEFAATRIFGPLGMSHTGFLDRRLPQGRPWMDRRWPAGRHRVHLRRGTEDL
jgi:CubicO group peptidase (beta-lactamase class C family)